MGQSLNAHIRRIQVHFATQFNVRLNVVKAHMPDEVQMWGKICQLQGGDTMNASEVVKSTEDRCDTTFVRVRLSCNDYNCRINIVPSR